jgi:hypothetical protein
MENLDVLLSDRFLQFTAHITQIATKKKQLKADFKVIYDKYQADVKALDMEAMQSQEDFELWKETNKKEEEDEQED